MNIPARFVYGPLDGMEIIIHKIEPRWVVPLISDISAAKKHAHYILTRVETVLESKRAVYLFERTTIESI
jgi:hypothetical protein